MDFSGTKVYKPTAGTDCATKDIGGAVFQGVLLSDTSGNVIGSATHPVRTDPTGTTAQPVSATALPLPTGAATSAKQDSQISALGATTDAKVQSDTGGSLIGFLRGLVSWFADLVGTVQQAPSQTKAIRVQIGPGDVISSLPITIDYDHHQIHEGESFRWSVLVPAAANTNTKYIKFIVPNIAGVVSVTTAVQKCPHFRFEVVADAAADVTFLEGTSSTGTGTQRTPVAMERNGTYTPSLQVWEDPTGVTEGTTIWRGMIAASKQIAGGIEGSGNEFVLKNNTTYFFKFVPVANNTKYLLRFVWYEDLGV